MTRLVENEDDEAECSVEKASTIYHINIQYRLINVE